MSGAHGLIDGAGETREDPGVLDLDLPDALPARSSTALLTSTWAALLAPRRLVPIFVIAGPLAVTEAYTGASAVETAFMCLLCVAFVLVAPASWRLLLPPVRLSAVAFAARVFGYAVVGAACVSFFGVILPWLVTRGHGSSGVPRLDISGAVTIALWWVSACSNALVVEVRCGSSPAWPRSNSASACHPE